MNVMEKTMFITVDDYQRIKGLIEFASLKDKSSDIADRLMKELKYAKTFPQDKIAEDIVTMNSRALLREINSGREIEITITYPEDADNRQQKVSVFSAIGVALLGCREGDITSWRVPGGIGRFKVERVLYQPEAQGHYSL
jgi:regulator of nucleoside diphosphate kinase